MVVIRFALMTYHSDACLENGSEQDEVTGRDALSGIFGRKKNHHLVRYNGCCDVPTKFFFQDQGCHSPGSGGLSAEILSSQREMIPPKSPSLPGGRMFKLGGNGL